MKPTSGRLAVALTSLLVLIQGSGYALGQQSDSTTPSQQQTTTTPAQQPQQTQQDQTTPQDGGPTGDNGAIAIPKKKEKDEAPPPLPPPPPKNPEGLGTLSLRVNVPEVDVNVGVILEKTHQFVPNLQQANFRVWEDGQPQQITHFHQIKAPITAVMLLEFASNSYYFIHDMRNAAWTFAQQLRPDDYVAVMTYDMHTEILSDFTTDKRVVMNALNTLTLPTWSETNLFDALYQTLDRLSRVEGRKYVVLISSGRDTFSKITLDKVLQKIRATPNVTIFTISTGQWIRTMTEGRGGMNSQIRDMNYLQADNQMNTFARMTGGMSFFPRFAGELPDDFGLINESIRNQYVLTYTPTNQKLDGTYRKLQIELVDNEGHPLRMQDEKHKPLKYDIISRDGYKAKQEVE
ncbi:VWA domain-containing protein [Silvibacterium sp.]|uniref:VWA domain-containing protein n=1 Tax=Silvibacterium sp. TaxID=1964179 RepID=UPI0039E2A59B